jgi:uncharacterized Fe-S cluster protein YjdI
MARKTYSGPLVDVSFDGELCRHAAECIRGMPSVFDTSARPWIDPRNVTTPEQADLLRTVVGRCPSGALEIVERPDATDVS